MSRDVVGGYTLVGVVHGEGLREDLADQEAVQGGLGTGTVPILLQTLDDSILGPYLSFQTHRYSKNFCIRSNLNV